MAGSTRSRSEPAPPSVLTPCTRACECAGAPRPPVARVTLAELLDFAQESLLTGEPLLDALKNATVDRRARQRFLFWRSQIDIPANTDAAVSVLILIPALIGYIVIRPTDPPLTRQFLLGVQLLALAAGAVPLVMAVLLLRYGGEPHCLTKAWLGPLIASWVLAGCLAVSWLRAAWVGRSD